MFASESMLFRFHLRKECRIFVPNFLIGLKSFISLVQSYFTEASRLDHNVLNILYGPPQKHNNINTIYGNGNISLNMFTHNLHTAELQQF